MLRRDWRTWCPVFEFISDEMLAVLASLAFGGIVVSIGGLAVPALLRCRERRRDARRKQFGGPMTWGESWEGNYIRAWWNAATGELHEFRTPGAGRWVSVWRPGAKLHTPANGLIVNRAFDRKGETS